MFKVKKNPNTPNILCDAESGKPICRFKNGVLETNDEALVKTLADAGYTVEGEPDKAPANPDTEPDGATGESADSNGAEGGEDSEPDKAPAKKRRASSK